jgi:chromosome segregation ATPase
MNRPKRISSVLRGAICIAALAASLSAPAQDIDNRPVYYVMLKSLEDGFQAYNAALATDLGARASQIKARYQSERLGVMKELESVQAQRTRSDTRYNAEREALNERIAAITEQMALRDGRINEERRIQKQHSPRYANDPRIKALKERIAAELATVESVRSDYLAQSNATQAARAALTRQIEEYMSAGDPLALEIRSLDEDWQRFSEAQRRKLKQVADAYAVDYNAYDAWLESERAVLDDMRAAVKGTLETNREQRALHGDTDLALRRLIDEYNALVEVHNKAGVADPQRDERAMKFATLEEQIAELQTTLTEVRDAVIRINEELTQRNQQLTQRYEDFATEKRKWDTTLAADRAELDATRLTVEAAIDSRHKKVNAQIKTLEAHISAELRDARNKLETLSTHLIESFGRDHGGFDTAIVRVVESNDPELLYTASGAPRFDLSRLPVASVYTAVENLEADRHKIDARIVAIEKSEGTSQNSTAPSATADAMERKLAEFGAQRQQLLEAYATSARQIQAESAALDKRRRSIDARFTDERALLGALYTARADLTRAEMQAIQGVLVEAATGLADTQSDGGNHAQLLRALSRQAARMPTPVDPSLLAPHAVMDQIASASPAIVSGARSDDWQAFLSRKVTASQTLSGSDKTAFAAAWLARLGQQARFVTIAKKLGASGAVTNGKQALSSLFMAGITDHASITEQRLEGGGIGIQVSILDRAYQLTANGSLEALPKV